MFVNVDDVLHQEVPLQAIDTMSVQDDLVPARRAAKTAPGGHGGGAPGLPQRVRGLEGPVAGEKRHGEA